MDITFKDKANIYPKARTKAMSVAPLSPLPEPSINIYEKRPLKTNSQNLSFKGLSSIKVSHAVKEFGNEFGESAGKYFKERILKANSIKNSGLDIEGDSIKFTQKPFAKNMLDILAYPVKGMVPDVINSVVYGLKRLTSNPHTLDSISEMKVFKNRREHMQSLSDAASIERYFSMVEKGQKGFKDGHTRFNPNVASYNAVPERVLTRLVTGSIPAFFLANDAYNLSTFMNDNKDMAKDEKKRRFNQEMARVGITAASTFAVLSMFSKKSNSSENVTVVLMALLTFASEVIGRKAAGVPVLPVGEKEALKYAKKRGKVQEQDNQQKPSGTNFEANLKTKKKEPNAAPPQKGKITFKNILKVLGVLVAAGFGVDKITSIKVIEKNLAKLNGKYKALYMEDYKISRNEFNQINKKLRENGFGKIAEKYEEMVKAQNGDVLNLGKAQNKNKYTLIHNILAFPVRFTWDTLMSPYKQVVKPLFKLIVNGGKKEVKAKKSGNDDMKILQNSLKFLKKIDAKADYKQRVNESILSSFDDVTKSGYSSAGLASTIRLATNLVTSAFLIADNYNLVMIDSQGKDKDLAEQKAKERLLQRTAKIIYSAFAIKLFNGVFAHTYNGSLLGAQSVNAVNTYISEHIERTSVGLPVKEATRDEIIEKEQKNLKAKGFKGAYFRFMAELTGKKPISARKDKDKDKK